MPQSVPALVLVGTSGHCGQLGLCANPIPSVAKGNSHVQPFPRMRISFLPLSGDPEVSTQLWGAWSAGWGAWQEAVGQTPPDTLHGVKFPAGPSFPPLPGQDPMQLPAGMREPVWWVRMETWMFPSVLPHGSSLPSLSILQIFLGQNQKLDVEIMDSQKTLFLLLGRAVTGSRDMSHVPCLSNPL